MDQGSIAEEHLGWYTLVNTCSSHVTLKRQNRRNEVALERVSEPLAVFAAENGKEYPHDRFNYAWKILMQNHPHDSICGCSVDQVNKEIEAGGTGHHAHRQGVLVAQRLPGLPPLPRHQLAELLLPVSDAVAPWFNEHLGPELVKDRNRAMHLLQEENELNEIVQLVGKATSLRNGIVFIHQHT